MPFFESIHEVPVEIEKCKVGDTVHYHWEDKETGHIEDFCVTITEILKDNNTGIVRIYAGNIGCLVYENEFDKTCKVVKVCDWCSHDIDRVMIYYKDIKEWGTNEVNYCPKCGRKL